MSEADKQAIWEWCGFKFHREVVFPVWESPIGEFRYTLPELTLDKIFRWAMPRIQELPGYRMFAIEHTGSRIFDSPLRWAVSIHFEVRYGENIDITAETLEDALAQAVLRLKEREVKHD